jgi:hypothetical protein
MLLPIYKVLPKFLDTFDKKIAQLGKVPEEARKKALIEAVQKRSPVFGPKGTAGPVSHAGH